MENKPEHGTRTDCVRDNRAVPLPAVSCIGYSVPRAKRGYWVRYSKQAGTYGRVIGRVRCEGKTYVEVITWRGHVRWIEPGDILDCHANPPWITLEFMLGKWTNPDKILRRAALGFTGNYGHECKAISRSKALREHREFITRHPELQV